MSFDAVAARLLILPSTVEADETVVVDTYDRREDLSVQVKLTASGRWHAKAIGGHFTKCGKPLGGYATRPEAYGPTRADMCDEGCFHPFELTVLLPHDPAAPDRPKDEIDDEGTDGVRRVVIRRTGSPPTTWKKP